MNVQARIIPDGEWRDYGECTIQEAAKMHSSMYHFEHAVMEVRWEGHATVWQCQVERVTDVRVKHRRQDQ